MANWKNVVSAKWLNERKHKLNVVIVDCRFHLTEPAKGKKEYEAGHIPNAHYLDLNEDLSGPVGKHGGRHPLPHVSTFVDKLSNIGVGNETTVVVYDDQNGMIASRLWWLLKYVGHEKVFVLDGGYSHWVNKGFAVTKEVPIQVKREFKPSAQNEMLVNVEYVKAKLHDPNTILVDSRAEERYLGLEEPLDKKAGHIPGAVNFFWGENVDNNGEWQQNLSSRFEALRTKEEIIVYCGSGVSACPNILAMQEVGITNVKLYAGSWSDWSSYDNNPIETKKRML